MDKVKMFIFSYTKLNSLDNHKCEIEKFVNDQDIEIVQHQETYLINWDTVMVTLYYREVKPFQQPVYIKK